MPTIPEASKRRFDSNSYFGLVAPPGTPNPLMEKLQGEIARIAAQPDFRQRHFIERGLEPVTSTPDEFGRFIANDRALAGQIVQEAGLQPQ